MPIFQKDTKPLPVCGVRKYRFYSATPGIFTNPDPLFVLNARQTDIGTIVLGHPNHGTLRGPFGPVREVLF